MPVTIDQRLQRALVRVLEDKDASRSERLEAARYLIDIRKGKPKPAAKPQRAKDRKPIADLLG